MAKTLTLKQAQVGGKKQASLQYFLTEFAVSIGITADKARYNKAWHKLWCRIHRLGLFKKA